MQEPTPDPSPVPCRVPVHHLTPHQVELVRAVLRAGEVPFGIVRGEVVAGAEHTEEIEKAVAWAGVDTTADAVHFDDPEYRSDRPPLVKPPRPPLPDGRHLAGRWRRLSGGLIDELLVGAPIVLAERAGAPAWSVASIHAVYHVAPVYLFGWSIGKLWCGTRVVELATLRRPSVWTAVVRWLVAGLPILLALFLGIAGDALTMLVAVIYAPIMFHLRGLHDLAARTVVAERTAAGPGFSALSALRRDRPRTRVFRRP